mmetsp:Transcript_51223/g.167442  ORF Transcript_51223/g.167442 Transcript_51223/m.167442 type:complete len:225 (+) Transcript_51223:1659-2333(+)
MPWATFFEKIYTTCVASRFSFKQRQQYRAAQHSTVLPYTSTRFDVCCDVFKVVRSPSPRIGCPLEVGLEAAAAAVSAPRRLGSGSKGYQSSPPPPRWSHCRPRRSRPPRPCPRRRRRRGTPRRSACAHPARQRQTPMARTPKGQQPPRRVVPTALGSWKRRPRARPPPRAQRRALASRAATHTALAGISSLLLRRPGGGRKSRLQSAAPPSARPSRTEQTSPDP